MKVLASPPCGCTLRRNPKACLLFTVLGPVSYFESFLTHNKMQLLSQPPRSAEPLARLSNTAVHAQPSAHPSCPVTALRQLVDSRLGSALGDLGLADVGLPAPDFDLSVVGELGEWGYGTGGQ